MERLDTIDSRVTRLEALQDERWRETILRIKRLEHILIGTAAATIMLLLSIVLK